MLISHLFLKIIITVDIFCEKQKKKPLRLYEISA